MIRGIEGYWEQQEVVDEIKESCTHAFPGEAAFTTQAIDVPAQAREWACRNYFAYCLAATGQYEKARQQLRIIGRRPIEKLLDIEWYKQLINALGFHLSPPNHEDHVDYMPVTEAIATPVADVPYYMLLYCSDC